MPERTDITPTAVAELMRDADKKRVQDAQHEILADHERDAQAVRDASWGMLLGDQTNRLANRMLFLARHPHLPSMLGGSALRVLTGQRPENVVTPPLLLPVEPDSVIKQGYFRAGYQFGLECTGGPRRVLYLHGLMTEQETQLTRKRQLLKIFFNYKDEELPLPAGGEFDRYKHAMQKSIFEQFVADNPWASDWSRPIEHCDGREISLTRNPGSPVISVEQLRKLRDDLEPRLAPLAGWDFPEEMYKDLYAVVATAADILGARELKR